jgi:hypothetical protein
VTVFQPGGIDGPFGFVLQESEFTGPLENGSQEAIKSPFFSSR